MATLGVNLVGIRDSVPMDLMPMVLESGSGLQYLSPLRKWATG